MAVYFQLTRRTIFDPTLWVSVMAWVKLLLNFVFLDAFLWRSNSIILWILRANVRIPDALHKLFLHRNIVKNIEVWSSARKTIHKLQEFITFPKVRKHYFNEVKIIEWTIWLHQLTRKEISSILFPQSISMLYGCDNILSHTYTHTHTTSYIIWLKLSKTLICNVTGL